MSSPHSKNCGSKENISRRKRKSMSGKVNAKVLQEDVESLVVTPSLAKLEMKKEGVTYANSPFFSIYAMKRIMT